VYHTLFIAVCLLCGTNSIYKDYFYERSPHNITISICLPGSLLNVNIYIQPKYSHQ